MKLPRRPDSHVLATEAEKALLAAVPNEWVTEKKVTDYGIDFEVIPFINELPAAAQFDIQLKGISQAATRNGLLLLDFPVATINYLRRRPTFAIVILFIRTHGLFHLSLDWFCDDFLASYKPTWHEQQQVRLYIPQENTFNRDQFVHLLHLLESPAETRRARRLQLLRVVIRSRHPATKELVWTCLTGELDLDCAFEYLPLVQSLFAGDPSVLAPLMQIVKHAPRKMASNALQTWVRAAADVPTSSPELKASLPDMAWLVERSDVLVAIDALAILRSLVARGLLPTQEVLTSIGSAALAPGRRGLSFVTACLRALYDMSQVSAESIALNLLNMPFGEATLDEREQYLLVLGDILTAGAPDSLAIWVHTLVETFVASLYDASALIGDALIRALRRSPQALRDAVYATLRRAIVGSACFLHGPPTDSEGIIRHYVEETYHEFMGHSPEDG